MRLDVVGDSLFAQVTACAMAQVGNQVTWWLPPGMVRQRVEAGQSAFKENELQQLFQSEQAGGRLRVKTFDQQPSEACADAVFLAMRPGNVDELGDLLAWVAAGNPRLLVNQTILPVGGSDDCAARLRHAGASTAVVVLPDTLQEGRGLVGFTRSDYMLVGCDDPFAETLIRELLRPFNRRRDVIQMMPPREAEFSRLSISAMLATRLSFMNDMAAAAEALGVDIEQVRQAMGADPRIGDAYLYPGCGFGGAGFSRDVMGLANLLQHSDVSTGLLERVMSINEQQKELLFRRFWHFYQGDVRGRTVTLWGLAFKPGTDRIDNAPSLALIDALWAQGVHVRAYDPAAHVALAEWADGRGDIALLDDPYDALAGADAMMLVTEWKAFWSPDWQRVKAQMATPLILDGRNVYDPVFMRDNGFIYRGVGRGSHD